jgi:hypothetical protein
MDWTMESSQNNGLFGGGKSDGFRYALPVLRLLGR